MAVLPRPGSSPSKLWNSYKIGLDVLNSKLNRKDPDYAVERDPLDQQLDALLECPGKARPTWERLFEAERRLIPLMSDEMVQADALRKFARGREVGLPETEHLEAAFSASKSPAHKRALHEQMVDSLQVHHFRRELERVARKRTASNLNGLGIMLLLPTVVVMATLVYQEQISTLAQYHIILVMWFGLLGAYLSRMIAFQSVIDEIRYDALVSGFSVWSVLVRLIVGAMGALIVYLMITGRLVGGDLFPNLTGASFFDQVKVNKKEVADGTLSLVEQVARAIGAGPDVGVTGFRSAVADTKPATDLMNAKEAIGAASEVGVADLMATTADAAAVNANMFSAQFAKLLVWATIAGFSERLLPDRLANIEAMAKNSMSSAVPNSEARGRA